MHYHCEIILPPDVAIEEAVASVMRPFDEDPEDYKERRNPFWDWYVLGGRFAGEKLRQSLDQAKLDEFQTWCVNEAITVSGLQCGKKKLQPVEQIQRVDDKWNELFTSPDGTVAHCPLFAHSNDAYANSVGSLLHGDICRLADALDVTCYRVIFAGPSYDTHTGTHSGPAEATFMLSESEWNGCNFQPTDWDGNVRTALEMFRKKLGMYKDVYRAKIEPQPDWLVVTVDYHS